MEARNQQEHLEFWSLRLVSAREIKFMCMSTSPNVLETLKLIEIDFFFFQPNNFVSWCHARSQFGNFRNKRRLIDRVVSGDMLTKEISAQGILVGKYLRFCNQASLRQETT